MNIVSVIDQTYASVIVLSAYMNDIHRRTPKFREHMVSFSYFVRKFFLGRMSCRLG